LLFLDASALVKRYIRERGSTRIRRLLTEGDVAIARLSEVEVASAFARLARAATISVAQRDRAMTTFIADLSLWTVVELTADTTRHARLLLLRHALRTGDAIQLASAMVLRDSIGELEAFVAHDARLLQAAQAEGMTVAR
jgi:hypothetical protein